MTLPRLALAAPTIVDFVAKANGRDYRLMITPPPGTPPASGWPVLWVLDGSGYHGMATDLVRNIGSIGGEIAPALVVAVTYPTDDIGVCLTRRTLDYTPTRDVSGEMEIVAGQLADSGDLDRFLDMLADEALPAVAARFPINRAAMALVGHSFGGLAALHTLFTRPEMFQSYIALCPSIWWDNCAVLVNEAAFAARVRSGEIAPRVFIAIGGMEQTQPEAIQPELVTAELEKVREVARKARMVDNAAELYERLKAIPSGPGYAVRYVCVPGETHMTTPPIVYPAALAMAFPPPVPVPLKLDDLYALERIREAKLLPGGAGVVFIVSRSVNDVETPDVRTVALDGSGMRTVAQGLSGCGGLTASPDGSVWALMSAVEGKPQVCLMDPATGAIRPVTALKQGVGSPPQWSPCGQWLAFTAVGEERQAKGPFDPIRTSSLFYKQDGVGFTDRTAQDVFVVSRAWCEVKRLTHSRSGLMLHGWSPAEGQLKLLVQSANDSDTLDSEHSLGTLDLDGTITWVIERDPEYIFGAQFSGDGQHLVVVMAEPGKAPGVASHVWTVPLSGGTRTCRSRGFVEATNGTMLNNVLFSTMTLKGRSPRIQAGHDYAVVGAQIGGHSSLWRVALSGAEACEAISPLDSGHFLIDANATHVLTFHSDHNTPADLYVSAHDGSARTRLTALHEAALGAFPKPEIRHFKWAAEDGTPLEAWMVCPGGATGPVPTVLDIHGGPQCAWGPGYWHFSHVLAARGIATLMPNPRGSSGYSEDFVAAIQGSFAQPADKDVLSAVDEAVRLGFADPERLGLAGISYGGFLSSWLLGQTTRFKAAVPEQLISNLVSMHGTSDAGREIMRTRFKVNASDSREALWQNSPLAFAHRATTPTLLVQCENDVRCPMGQAEEMFVALREAGCEAEFLRIPGSAHAGPQISGISALARVRDEPVLEWFTRHLLAPEGATSQ